MHLFFVVQILFKVEFMTSAPGNDERIENFAMTILLESLKFGHFLHFTSLLLKNLECQTPAPARSGSFGFGIQCHHGIASDNTV
jgi:hypothetical protein